MLTFDKDLHQYYWNGAPVDSVTQILSGGGVSDYSQIPEHLIEEVQQRGTLVHAAAQAYDKLVGDRLVRLENLNWPQLPDRIRPYVSAYVDFRISTGIVPLKNEIMGYNSELCYAGTADLIARMPDGRIMLIDLKSGPLLPSVAIQTIAYAEMDEVKAQFPVLERHGLQLKNDGKFKFSLPYTHPGHLTVLKSAINVHRFNQGAA